MYNAIHRDSKKFSWWHIWIKHSVIYLWGYYEIKKSVGWTIDKFRLNNSLAINGTILRVA